MNGAMLSALALYNNDNTLFENFRLPAGLDRDTVINNLLMETAEFEVLYPDGDFFKQAIGTWSDKQLPIWEKLYNTLLLEYNPLENYDRLENWTDNAEGSNYNRTESTGTQNGQTTENNKSDSTGNSTMTVAGFNSNDWGNREKTDTSGEVTEDNSVSSEMQHEDEATSQGNNTHEAVHSGRVHGNIGVTTSQQMLEAEREVVQFNIIDHIINDFKNRFCLLIY